MIAFPQMPEVADFARAVPELSIILNHIGALNRVGMYANREDEVRAAWRGSLRWRPVPISPSNWAVWACPAWFDWHTRAVPIGSEALAADMAPWMQYCIEQFGPERCMFESNFPPDKVSFSYNVLYNAFKRLSVLTRLPNARRCSMTRRPGLPHRRLAARGEANDALQARVRGTHPGFS